MAKKSEKSNDAQAVNKSEAIRQALKEGIENPTEGVQFVKDRYGVEIGAQLFSSVKSRMKQAGASGEVKAGGSGAVRVPRADATIAHGRSPAELARQVKELIAAYGAEEVAGMVKVLGD